MSLRIARPKLRPGRGKLVLKPKPRKHKDVTPFYVSAAWRELVADIKRVRGDRCEDPDHPPRLPRSGVRIFADHVWELKDGGPSLDPNNVTLRCGKCHAKKTWKERFARKSGGVLKC